MPKFDLYIKKIKDMGFLGEILENEPMSKHTTMKVGGNARLFITPLNAEDIRVLRESAKELEIGVKIIGNGSNLLVRDSGFDGVIISLLGTLDDIKVEGNKIICGAGAINSKIANLAQKNSLSGMEFLAGIPGTVGGAVFMNAGAYDGEIINIVKTTTYLNEKNELCTVSGTAHEFSYRHSMFKDNRDFVIISTEIELKNGNTDEILAKMQDFAERRRDKQPLNFPSSGSTFKRPEGQFAGALIEKSGLKGFKIGGAMVSEKHAGFVINSGGATCTDVLELIEHIKNVVYKDFGVELQCEVEII